MWVNINENDNDIFNKFQSLLVTITYKYNIFHIPRYVVATRDLSPGEVIMQESPVTAGPKQFTPPVCLGCYSPDVIVTASSESEEASFRVCSRCEWPICSEECEQAPIHKLECSYLKVCQSNSLFGYITYLNFHLLCILGVSLQAQAQCR